MPYTWHNLKHVLHVLHLSEAGFWLGRTSVLRVVGISGHWNWGTETKCKLCPPDRLPVCLPEFTPLIRSCSLERDIYKVKVKSLSRVRLFTTPWTVAYQAPPSMGFSRQEYWSGLPFPSPGDLPNPGIEPRSPALQAEALISEPP